MALSQPTHSTSQSRLPQISADHQSSLAQPSISLQDPTTIVQSPLSAAEDSPLSTSADSTNRHGSNYKHRQSALSTSFTKPNRGGLFTLAALARDKTSSAIASLSEPSIRSRPSSGSLYRSAQSSATSASYNSTSLPRSADLQSSSQENADSPVDNNTSPPFAPFSHSRRETVNSATLRQSLLETDPPSQAYSNTATDTPAPITFVPPGNYNKMHQTSSRLLRMTSDDRPFTRVSMIRWNDLCCTDANNFERTLRIYLQH